MKRLIIIFLCCLVVWLFLGWGFPAAMAWTLAVGISDEIIFYGKYIVGACGCFTVAAIIHLETL